jgi:hypothetical protein
MRQPVKLQSRADEISEMLKLLGNHTLPDKGGGHRQPLGPDPQGRGRFVLAALRAWRLGITVHQAV